MIITRLIYYSQNHIDPHAGSAVRVLSDILNTSNRNNRAQELTGALIFDNQWFLQTLEGTREKVWRAFETIREDERHSDVVVAEVVETDQRIFGNWWMGLATRNAATEAAFAAVSQNGRLDPTRMTAAQILGLMTAVASIGLSRELAAPRAA